MNEIESTLIVCSSEPYEVVKRIAALDSISEYALVPQQAQNIKDTYFDRPDHALESKKIGLRIRVVDGERLITMKGPSKLHETGASERLELELKWSEDGLRSVIDELRRWGVEIEGLRESLDLEHPLRALSELGFEVKQRRENSREVRNVVPQGDSGYVLAELVIDSITFDLTGQQAHHKEVEIEAKSVDGAKLLGSLTEYLKNMFPNDLVPWYHSKLAIGLAVKDLADSGELKALLDEQDSLKPEAYSRIDAYLRDRDL